MKNFQLLKQTFPVSEFDRECDGYVFIMKRLQKPVREQLGIDDKKLQKIINSTSCNKSSNCCIRFDPILS